MTKRMVCDPYEVRVHHPLKTSNLQGDEECI